MLHTCKRSVLCGKSSRRKIATKGSANNPVYVHFNRDLLIIDTETTGLDPKIHRVLQLAGILLDKNTLETRQFFTSYIYAGPKDFELASPKALEINHITPELVASAPRFPTAWSNLTKTFQEFSYDLAGQKIDFDITMLRRMCSIYRQPWPFDRSIDLWSMFYSVAAIKNLPFSKRYAGLNAMKEHFSKIHTTHDALQDCEDVADILRQFVRIIGS